MLALVRAVILIVLSSVIIRVICLKTLAFVIN